MIIGLQRESERNRMVKRWVVNTTDFSVYSLHQVLLCDFSEQQTEEQVVLYAYYTVFGKSEGVALSTIC